MDGGPGNMISMLQWVAFSVLAGKAAAMSQESCY